MSGLDKPIPMSSKRVSNLRGQAKVPGDKSISHRSLILGALSVGQTKIHGLLEGQDVIDTAKAMSSFGALVEKHENGYWTVDGFGVGGFAEPEKVIDCGNSGTGVRLIMGAMSTTDITATFTGDASLNRRPMARITEPLNLFGAKTYGRRHGKLPITVVGAASAVPITYQTPVASAQIKSSILFAGLNTAGETTIIEKEKTRDHTERMLQGFGAEVETETTSKGHIVRVKGYPELLPQEIKVPRDPSSAAFPVCAALITEGSDVLVPNIGLNPTRSGLFETLREMNANITFENESFQGGEPVADIRAKFSPNMIGIDVPPKRAASMIDEYPILSVVASFAKGKTLMREVSELRVKESDRIDAMAKGLRSNGLLIEEGEDWWSVEGREIDGVKGGGLCETFLDHRIAMSFLILGMASKSSVKIDDSSPITTSFPIFESLMAEIGANFQKAEL
ncbi:MAG: 3-phosphoshikimate 1-carboxyvinyltransferase [Rhodobacteraceae bacterium TMED111]|nr:3-phosphoshikimate 1-carboxyvinyltransferase [Marinovum sp.]OUV40196.1 MAG: 3-phosphoshikimate 1-carboxyvinyltransferase [Rhodobacteraceae bacterium TMED111]